MYLQPDGKILICGNFTSFNGASRIRVARLNADGTLDDSFTTTGTGFNNIVRAIALQPDGKMVVVGQFTNYNGTARSRIARINADGSLDATFSVGTGFNSNAMNVKLQTDGKILVCGDFISDYNGYAFSARLIRLNTDGTRDISFNTNFTANFQASSQGLAIQADGKILASGKVYVSSDGIVYQGIVRVNTDGTLDECFRSPYIDGGIQEIVLQPDEKILIVGVITNYWNSETAGIAGAIRLKGGIDSYLLPSAPTSLSASTGSYSAQINFTPGLDGGSAISNYQYSLNGGTTWTSFSPAVTTSPVTITGLVHGDTYTVLLRSVNCKGPSPSESVTFTMPPPTAPGAPTVTSTTADVGSITVNFTAGSDGNSPITNYEYSLDGGITWITRNPAATTSPILIQGLSN
jgi:uncharacterized delta-60 repeat protein